MASNFINNSGFKYIESSNTDKPQSDLSSSLKTNGEWKRIEKNGKNDCLKWVIIMKSCCCRCCILKRREKSNITFSWRTSSQVRLWLHWVHPKEIHALSLRQGKTSLDGDQSRISIIHHMLTLSTWESNLSTLQMDLLQLTRLSKRNSRSSYNYNSCLPSLRSSHQKWLHIAIGWALITSFPVNRRTRYADDIASQLRHRGTNPYHSDKIYKIINLKISIKIDDRF